MPESITAMRGPSRRRRRQAAVVADAFSGDLAGEVLAGHRWLRVDQLARLCLGHRRGEYAAAHRAGLADVHHERARVDAADRLYAAVAQPVEPASLGARRILAVTRLAHDRGARPRPL